MSTETIITGAPAAEPLAGDASFWKSNLRDYGLLVSLLLIMAFFEVVTGGVLFRGERGQAYRDAARWLGSGSAATLAGVEA